MRKDFKISFFFFLPSHQGFVLAQSLSFIPHEVQDGRGGLLLEGRGLAFEAQPEPNSRAIDWRKYFFAVPVGLV